MSPSLLSVHELYLRRGDAELFNGLCLQFLPGELCWLRAPNGRGKTTLLRILAGLLTPDRGRLSWRGASYADRLDEPRQAISLLDERLGLSRDLSVRDNLQYALQLAGGGDLAALLDQFDLQALGRRPVRQLSTGQKKRVALARLMAERAQVWLLDEPANGLDTHNRQILARHMLEFVGDGGLCIYASHDALPLGAMQPRVLELSA